jgi:hypothetical protein
MAYATPGIALKWKEWAVLECCWQRVLSIAVRLISEKSGDHVQSFFLGGLKDNPFNVNPEPRYLYFNKEIEEALSGLKYGVQKKLPPRGSKSGLPHRPRGVAIWGRSLRCHHSTEWRLFYPFPSLSVAAFGQMVTAVLRQWSARLEEVDYDDGQGLEMPWLRA